MTMKLQQLQVFVAVIDHGGIRAAARQLNVSQAAVTKSMRLLEESAGVPLLTRKTRGVTVTDAGNRVLSRARVIARQFALAHEDLRQSGGDDFGTLRIGVTPYLTLTGLGQAFNWFRQRYQKVEIQLMEGLMARVLPGLREGTLDIAVVAADLGEVRDQDFHCRHLQQARQCIVVRKDHPVLANPTAKALASLEWVFTQPIGAGQQPRVEAMFALAGVEPPSQIVLCETLAAITLLRNSDCASIVPQPMLGLPETRDVVEVERSPLRPCDIELLLLTQPEVPLTPAAEYFARCLTDVSQSLANDLSIARPARRRRT